MFNWGKASVHLGVEGAIPPNSLLVSRLVAQTCCENNGNTADGSQSQPNPSGGRLGCRELLLSSVECLVCSQQKESNDLVLQSNKPVNLRGVADDA